MWSQTDTRRLTFDSRAGRRARAQFRVGKKLVLAVVVGVSVLMSSSPRRVCGGGGGRLTLASERAGGLHKQRLAARWCCWWMSSRMRGRTGALCVLQGRVQHLVGLAAGVLQV